MRFFAALSISLLAMTSVQAAEPDPNAPTPRMAIKFILEQVPQHGGFNHWMVVDEEGYQTNATNVIKVEITKNALVLNERIDLKGVKRNDDSLYKARFSFRRTTFPILEIEPKNEMQYTDFGGQVAVKCKTGDCITREIWEGYVTEASSLYSAHNEAKETAEERFEKDEDKITHKLPAAEIPFMDAMRATKVSNALHYLAIKAQKGEAEEMGTIK